MTVLFWSLIGVMVVATVATHRIGTRIRLASRERTASEPAPAALPEQQQVVRIEPPATPAQADAVAMSAVSVLPSYIDVFAAPSLSPADGPVVEVLGVPSLLMGIYASIKEDPEIPWDCHAHSIEIDEFDTPSRLISHSETLPVIEMPIYAFLNAKAHDPDGLLAVERNFEAGKGTRQPFRFVCSNEASTPRQLGVEDLRGKTINVLGRWMSPTVILLRTLEAFGVETQVWDLAGWWQRTPSADRVDVLVGDSLDGQIHALRSQQADLALVIFPYTHSGRQLARHASPVDLGLVEQRMRRTVSGRLLNVLVTNGSLYRSDERWRRRVEAICEAVRIKNEVLEKRSGGASTFDAISADALVEEALLSHEIAWVKHAEDSTDVLQVELQRAASDGSDAGLPALDPDDARNWTTV